MEKKSRKSQMWPMEYILGGILTIAVIVLVSFGLRPEPDQAERDGRSAPRSEATPTRVVRETPPPSVTTPPAEETAPAQTAALPAPVVETEAAPETASAPPTFAEAEALYRGGDFAAAAEEFAAYADARPDNPWGHFMLGLSEWRLGRHAEAEVALVAATDLSPAESKFWLNLSRVRMAAGELETALAAAEKAVELAPESAGAARVLGRALHNLARSEEALAAYSAALTHDPRDAWALNNLGLILIEQERFAESLPALALAVSLDGGTAVFQNNLGVALERCGHPTSAALAYARALELEPDHERAVVSLARVELLAAGETAPDLVAIAAGLSERIAGGRFPWAEGPASVGEEGPLIPAGELATAEREALPIENPDPASEAEESEAPILAETAVEF